MNKYALDLIKHFEGLKLTSYQDVGGIWTIGYGHTGNVKPHSTITEEQAEDFLKKDLSHVEPAVAALVQVDLTDKQMGALISFAYNLGVARLASSSLLRKINANDSSAADEFLKWDHVGGKVIPGLLKRREAERDLFL